MSVEPVRPKGLRVGATFAAIAGACLALLGLVMGIGALITGGLWIALAAAGAYALLAAVFVLAGRRLRQGRRASAVVLALLTLLLGFGVIKGEFTLLLPFLPAAGGALTALLSWRQLSSSPPRGIA